MAKGRKTGGRVKASQNHTSQAARLVEKCAKLGLDVEEFFALTALGSMTCGKCLGKKRMPGKDKQGRIRTNGPACDRCAGTGHEILEPAPRIDAASELFARMLPKLKSVELGVGLGGGKGSVSLAEALKILAEKR